MVRLKILKISVSFFVVLKIFNFDFEVFTLEFDVSGFDFGCLRVLINVCFIVFSFLSVLSDL